MAPFSAAASLIERAILDRVTPAAVLEVGRTAGPYWRAAFGALTYDRDAPACTPATVFDLASLTKVIAAAPIAARLSEAGRLAIDAPVSKWNPAWRTAEKSGISVRQLLDHSSGLPAHVKLFETARGREEFRAAIAQTPLAYGPGLESRYSDLGFIELGFLLEDAAAMSLTELFAPLASHLGAIGFLPGPDWRDRTAPTERDRWRKRLLCGEVHDENAAALGGVAAHAGLFGDAEAVGRYAQTVLQTFDADTWLCASTTMRTLATRSRVPRSSRALGWDTMLPTSSCGTRMSARAIGHTGFTGTSLWVDPETDVYVVLLTNRVHPSRYGEGIQALRRTVHDAVMEEIGAV